MAENALRGAPAARRCCATSPPKTRPGAPHTHQPQAQRRAPVRRRGAHLRPRARPAADQYRRAAARRARRPSAWERPRPRPLVRCLLHLQGLRAAGTRRRSRRAPKAPTASIPTAERASSGASSRKRSGRRASLQSRLRSTTSSDTCAPARAGIPLLPMREGAGI